MLRKKLKSLGYITVYVEYLKAFEWSVLPTLLMDPIRNQLCKCRSFDTTFKASVEVESQMPWSFLFSRQMTTLTVTWIFVPKLGSGMRSVLLDQEGALLYHSKVLGTRWTTKGKKDNSHPSLDAYFLGIISSCVK